jgi:2,3,4,5-tetrahydropyridine-2-carboxylate N-succinyltransferase
MSSPSFADIAAVRQAIQAAFQKEPAHLGAADRQTFDAFKALLVSGQVRAAEPSPESHLGWQVNAWVKQGILLGFRLGRIVEMEPAGPLGFCDKDTYPARRFAVSDGVRVVPGGTSVRDTSHVAPGVIIMPPAFVNVGAFVDRDTMIDSHALVGSCAQVGQRVHLSAAAQLGGVLEPVGGLPVIVEDDVVVGGNAGVYEGTVVRRRAVLGAGVILTRSTPLYDLVEGRIIRGSAAAPLVVPEGAVVVPGSRPVREGFAATHGVSLYCPVVVKYRDERTDAATALEEALR